MSAWIQIIKRDIRWLVTPVWYMTHGEKSVSLFDSKFFSLIV